MATEAEVRPEPELLRALLEALQAWVRRAPEAASASAGGVGGAVVYFAGTVLADLHAGSPMGWEAYRAAMQELLAAAMDDARQGIEARRQRGKGGD